MPDSCSVIIERLVEERHNQGLSQRQLAQNAQLPQSVIARLESKKVMPQLDTLVKIATALGCTLEIKATSQI